MTDFEKASDLIEREKSDGTDCENVIEWLRNMDRATVSFSQGRMVSKIRKLKEEYPNDVNIYSDNGNSIVAHIPVKWIKVSPPRKISDEQKEAAAERFRKMWADKQEGSEE